MEISVSTPRERKGSFLPMGCNPLGPCPAPQQLLSRACAGPHIPSPWGLCWTPPPKSQQHRTNSSGQEGMGTMQGRNGTMGFYSPVLRNGAKSKDEPHREKLAPCILGCREAIVEDGESLGWAWVWCGRDDANCWV